MTRQGMTVIVTGIVGLSIIFFITSIMFFANRDIVDGNKVKVECIKAGKDWVINDKSDMDSPKYECVAAGE